MNPFLLLIVLGAAALAAYWLSGLLSRSKAASREEELLELARAMFGATDSAALRRLYDSRFRMALRERQLGAEFEDTLRDTILIFNLRNHALESEIEGESEFSITEGGS